MNSNRRTFVQEVKYLLLIHEQWEGARNIMLNHVSDSVVNKSNTSQRIYLIFFTKTIHPYHMRWHNNGNCCLLSLSLSHLPPNNFKTKEAKRGWWWLWWPICCWHNPEGWRHGDAIFVSLTVAVSTNQYTNPASLSRGVITSTHQKLFVLWFRWSA